MGALVLALGALLVSLDPAGGAREPGKDGPLGCGGSWGRWAHPAATAHSWVGAQRTPPRGWCCPTGKNLSCYQCFKVRSPEFCLPAMCSSTDQVCVSHTLIITLSEYLARAEGDFGNSALDPLGSQWGTDGGSPQGTPACAHLCLIPILSTGEGPAAQG